MLILSTIFTNLVTNRSYFILIFCLILYFPITALSQEITRSHEERIRQKLQKGESIAFTEEDRKLRHNLVQANWIVEAIKERKNIDITNAVIEGELDFHHIETTPIYDCPKEVREVYQLWEERCVLIMVPISFKDCEFKKIIRAGERGRTIVAFEEGVDFSGCTFLRPPDFSRAFFSKQAYFVPSNLPISFPNGARFYGANFHCEANFKNANFGGKTDFSSARFKGNAYFVETKFIEAIFEHAWFFDGYVNFYNAEFKGEANFTDVDFKEAYFSSTKFRNKANFARAKFWGKTFFLKTFFEGDGAIFHNVKFLGKEDINFSEIICRKGILDFRDANFGGEETQGKAKPVVFSRAQFENVRFNHVGFYRDVIFSYVTFNNAEFSKALFWQKTLTDYDLKQRPIGGIQGKVRNEKLSSVSLNIEGTVFGIVQGLTWEQIALPLCIRYFQLKGDMERSEFFHTMARLQDNFRRTGLFDDANAIYYERKVMESEHEKFPKNYGFILLELLCGYGTHFLRLLIFAGSMVMLSSFAYLGFAIKGFRKGKCCPVCINDREEKQRSKWCLIWHPFYLSIITFTTLGLGGAPAPGGYRIVIILEGMLGWLTLALFVFTLANSVLT